MSTRATLSVDPSKAFDEMQSRLNCDAKGVVSCALTLLEWAIEERLKGRRIAAIDADGRLIEYLNFETLNKIQPRP